MAVPGGNRPMMSRVAFVGCGDLVVEHAEPGIQWESALASAPAASDRSMSMPFTSSQEIQARSLVA